MLKAGLSLDPVFVLDSGELELATSNFTDLLPLIRDFSFDMDFQETGIPLIDRGIEQFYRHLNSDLLAVYSSYVDSFSNRTPLTELERRLQDIPLHVLDEDTYRKDMLEFARMMSLSGDDCQHHTLINVDVFSNLFNGNMEDVKKHLIIYALEFARKKDDFTSIDAQKLCGSLLEINQSLSLVAKLLINVYAEALQEQFSELPERIEAAIEKNSELIAVHEDRLGDEYTVSKFSEAMANCFLGTIQLLRDLTTNFGVSKSAITTDLLESLIQFFEEHCHQRDIIVFRILMQLFYETMQKSELHQSWQGMHAYLSCIEFLLFEYAIKNTSNRKVIIKSLRPNLETLSVKHICEDVYKYYHDFTMDGHNLDKNRGIRFTGQIDTLRSDAMRGLVECKWFQSYGYPAKIGLRRLASAEQNREVEPQPRKLMSWQRPIEDLIEGHSNSYARLHLRFNQRDVDIVSSNPCARLGLILDPEYEREQDIQTFDAALAISSWRYEAQPQNDLRRFASVETVDHYAALHIYDPGTYQRFLITAIYNKVIDKLFKGHALLVNDYRNLKQYVDPYIRDDGSIIDDHESIPADVLFLLVSRNKTHAEAILTSRDYCRRLFLPGNLTAGVKEFRRAHLSGHNARAYRDFNDNFDRMANIAEHLYVFLSRYKNSIVSEVIHKIIEVKALFQSKNYDQVFAYAFSEQVFPGAPRNACEFAARYYLTRIEPEEICARLSDERLAKIKDDKDFLQYLAGIDESVAKRLLEKKQLCHLQFEHYDVIDGFPRLLATAEKHHLIYRSGQGLLMFSRPTEFVSVRDLAHYLGGHPQEFPHYAKHLKQEEFVVAFTELSPETLFGLFMALSGQDQKQFKATPLWMLVHQGDYLDLSTYYSNQEFKQMSFAALWQTYFRLLEEPVYAGVKLSAEHLHHMLERLFDLLNIHSETATKIREKLSHAITAEEQAFINRYLSVHLRKFCESYPLMVKNVIVCEFVRKKLKEDCEQQAVDTEFFEMCVQRFFTQVAELYKSRQGQRYFASNLPRMQRFIQGLVEQEHELLYDTTVLSHIAARLCEFDHDPNIKAHQVCCETNVNFAKKLMAQSRWPLQFHMLLRQADQLDSQFTWLSVLKPKHPLSSQQRALVQLCQPALGYLSQHESSDRRRSATIKQVMCEILNYMTEKLPAERTPYRELFRQFLSPERILTLLQINHKSPMIANSLKCIQALLSKQMIPVEEFYAVYQHASPDLVLHYLIINHIDVEALSSKMSTDIVMVLVEKIIAQNNQDFIVLCSRFEKDVNFGLNAYVLALYRRLVLHSIETFKNYCCTSKSFQSIAVKRLIGDIPLPQISVERFLNFPYGSNVTDIVDDTHIEATMNHLIEYPDYLMNIYHLLPENAQLSLRQQVAFWKVLHPSVPPEDAACKRLFEELAAMNLRQLIECLREYKKSGYQVSGISYRYHDDLKDFIMELIRLRCQFDPDSVAAITDFMRDVERASLRFPSVESEYFNWSSASGLRLSQRRFDSVRVNRSYKRLQDDIAIAEKFFKIPEVIACYQQSSQCTTNQYFVSRQARVVKDAIDTGADLNPLVQTHQGNIGVWEKYCFEKTAHLIKTLNKESWLLIIQSALTSPGKLSETLESGHPEVLAEHLFTHLVDLIDADIVRFISLCNLLPETLADKLIHAHLTQIIEQAVAADTTEIFCKGALTSYWMRNFDETWMNRLAYLILLIQPTQFDSALLITIVKHCDVDFLLQIILQEHHLFNDEIWAAVYQRLLDILGSMQYPGYEPLISSIILNLSYYGREEQLTLGSVLPGWMRENPQSAVNHNIVHLLKICLSRGNVSEQQFLALFASLGKQAEYINHPVRKIVRKRLGFFKWLTTRWLDSVVSPTSQNRQFRCYGDSLVDILLNEVKNNQINREIAAEIMQDRMLDYLIYYLVFDKNDADIDRLRKLFKSNIVKIQEKILGFIAERGNFQGFLVDYDDIAQMLLDSLSSTTIAEQFKYNVLVKTKILLRNSVFAAGLAKFLSHHYLSLEPGVVHRVYLNLPENIQSQFRHHQVANVKTQPWQALLAFSTPQLTCQVLQNIFEDHEFISKQEVKFIDVALGRVLEVVNAQADLPYLLRLFSSLIDYLNDEMVEGYKARIDALLSKAMHNWNKLTGEVQSSHNMMYMIDFYLIIANKQNKQKKYYDELINYLRQSPIWRSVIEHASSKQLLKLFKECELIPEQVTAIFSMKAVSQRLACLSDANLAELMEDKHFNAAICRGVQKDLAKHMLRRQGLMDPKMDPSLAPLWINLLLAIPLSERHEVPFIGVKALNIIEAFLNHYASCTPHLNDAGRLRLLHQCTHLSTLKYDERLEALPNYKEEFMQRIIDQLAHESPMTPVYFACLIELNEMLISGFSKQKEFIFSTFFDSFILNCMRVQSIELTKVNDSLLRLCKQLPVLHQQLLKVIPEGIKKVINNHDLLARYMSSPFLCFYTLSASKHVLRELIAGEMTQVILDNPMCVTLLLQLANEDLTRFENVHHIIASALLDRRIEDYPELNDSRAIHLALDDLREQRHDAQQQDGF